LRTDFMIDKNLNGLKMIEFNTVAAGMGSMWGCVKYLHSYLQDKYEFPLKH